MARTNTNSGGGGGGVATVTASLPLASSGGANPNISINQPAANRVWYTSSGGVLTGDANFTRNVTDDRFTFASTIDASFGIFYNGTASPNPLGNHVGLGIDQRAGSVVTTLGSVGFGNSTRLEIADNAVRTDLYTQDFYVRAYGSTLGIFAELTNTYSNVMIGDCGNNYTGTRIYVEESNSYIHNYTPGKYEIISPTSVQGFYIDFVGRDYALGQLAGAGNGNLLWIEDDNNIISARTPGYFHVTSPSNEEWLKVDVASTIVSIGDISSIGNDTKFILNDTTKVITANTNLGFNIEDSSANQFFSVNTFFHTVSVGDVNSVFNGTRITLDDVSRGITGSAILAGAGGSFFASATGSGVLYSAGGVGWGFQPDATGGGRTSIIANNITWTWPNADSVGTQALVSNGAGVLSWATPGTGNVTGSGTAPRIPYWNSATALIDDADFTRLVNRGLKVMDAAARENVFIGNLPGNIGIAGTQNIAIGSNPGQSLTSGTRNIFLGQNSGFETTASQNAVYLGVNAGQRMRADDSVAIGYGAMFGSGTPANNTGQRNIAIGRDSLASVTSGQNNIAIGYNSAGSIANGASIIAIGQSAASVLTASQNSVYIGDQVSTGRTSGDSNVYIGATAGGSAAATGGENVVIGMGAGPLGTSHARSVIIGKDAASTLTTGNENTVIGQAANVAAAGTTGAIALGYQASAATNEFAIPNAITNFKFQGDSYTLPTAFPSANDKAMVSSTAGVMTWGPVISSGFYTPTLTNVSNISASVAYDAQWMRIGNVVTVGGRVEVDPTAGSTPTELGISLPIASDIQGLEGVVGTAFSSTVQQGGAIQGDAANDRAQLTFDAATTANSSMYYTYIYTII